MTPGGGDTMASNDSCCSSRASVPLLRERFPAKPTCGASMLITSPAMLTVEAPCPLEVRLILLDPLTPYSRVWVLLTYRMGCWPKVRSSGWPEPRLARRTVLLPLLGPSLRLAGDCSRDSDI